MLSALSSSSSSVGFDTNCCVKPLCIGVDMTGTAEDWSEAPDDSTEAG